MSQSKRNNTPAGQANPLPGMISAAVVIIVLGLIALLLFNRSNTQPAAQSPAAETALPLPTSPAPPISPVPTSQADSPAYNGPPPMTIDPAKNYTATITTPRGEIVIRLRPDIAPQTVNNFVFLARAAFYNGLTWHRVIEDFMAQGGDPLGDGTGGPGYTIPAEFTEQILFDRPGMVATARRSDTTDSNGSQFFITTAPAPHLNAQYTIFGEVVSGQEIVDGIPLRDPLTAGTPGEQILQISVTEG